MVVDEEADMVVDKVADMEVEMVADRRWTLDKVSDMVADEVADMVVDKVAYMVADMEVGNVADMVVNEEADMQRCKKLVSDCLLAICWLSARSLRPRRAGGWTSFSQLKVSTSSSLSSRFCKSWSGSQAVEQSG